MKKLSTNLMILLLCLATGIHAAPVTHDSQSVLRIKGGEKSHRVQTSMIRIPLPSGGFMVVNKAAQGADIISGRQFMTFLADSGKASQKAARAARAAKLAKGGAIAAVVVVVVATVVATVLITKKVKKDNRQRRAKLKKLKKYQKLRARAEIEYAHRHRSSKWRYRVR
jgi:hypothetical protein